MEDPVHMETDKARSGVTNHNVRYVLAISLLLVIIALSAIWITGAVNAPPATSSATTAVNTQAPS